LALLYAKNGFCFPTISAEPPKSYTHFSQGVIVQRHVHVSTNCTIGCFAKINVGANVMHDVILEDYCTIAPNAVLLGGVKVGEGAMVGAHATVLPHVRIGKYATVGAGAVVTKDVPDRTVVKGVPAR
jgi:acetyltransferase EpsM